MDESAGDEPDTLQSRLEGAGEGAPDDEAGRGHAAADLAITDPVALLRHLDVSGHFHRDSRLGRAFHSGMVSLRENVPTDSLHVSIDGNRMTAHVDGISPLALESEGSSRYSARRAVKHNLAGMAADLVWLLRGRQGDHRCVLDCEWDTGGGGSAPEDLDLLDPGAAAWSVQLEVRVTGAFDESRLRAALRATVGDHARQRDPVEVVDCRDDADLDAARVRLQSLPVAVTGRPPLHVYLARHPGGDVLMLNLNHAAADGAGALRVLDALAGAYARDAAPAAPLDFLAARGLPVGPAAPSASPLARSGKRAVELLRDALSRTAGLAADQPDDEPGYGFHLVALSAQETADLAGVTSAHPTGHLLMAALHLAIGDWNLEHGKPGGRIGVLVPADLRPATWPEDAIANVSVMARLSTSRRERAGPASALKAIAAQAARNKRTRTGIALIAALQRAGMLALWAKQSTVVLQPLTGNRLVDAAMLGDLGGIDAPDFGQETGDTVAVWFSAPARAPQSLCVGAVTVAGRLYLTFRYPHRRFGPDAARRFAGRYVDTLRRVADR